MSNDFDVIPNPYCYYEGEPSHVARFIEDGKKYLCGWCTEANLPYLKHHESVIKMADEMGYKLPCWIEVPKWVQDLL